MARDARILRLAPHNVFIRRNTNCALRGLAAACADRKKMGFAGEKTLI